MCSSGHRRSAIGILLLAVGIGLGISAQAHGDWPAKHGGIMNRGGETSFELVLRRGTVELYVEDHGTPVPTAGAQGSLKITRANGVTETPLLPSGDNRLSGKATAGLGAGETAVARVVLGNGSIVVGRFGAAAAPR